jgi:hypothetical protein
MKSYADPVIPNPLKSEPRFNEATRRGSSSEEECFPKRRYLEDIGQIGILFDQNLFEKINKVDHIKETELQLEQMKNEIKDKKRLQKERNVLTAQLSRDRKKLEVELLRKYCYEATQALNMVRNVI